MRPTPVQDRRPGTSADVPDVPSPTSMPTKNTNIPVKGAFALGKKS